MNLSNNTVSFENNQLTLDVKIENYVQKIAVLLNGNNVTKKYLELLKLSKLTQKNWRFNKSTQRVTLGFSNHTVLFSIIPELEIIEFIKKNI